jgi:hypothetical protein
MYTYRYTSWMTLAHRQWIYSRLHHGECLVIRSRPYSFSSDALIFDRLGFASEIILFPEASGFHSAYIYTGNSTQTNILPCEFVLLESKNKKITNTNKRRRKIKRSQGYRWKKITIYYRAHRPPGAICFPLHLSVRSSTYLYIYIYAIHRNDRYSLHKISLFF